MTSKTATSLALVLIGVGVVLRLGFLGADSLWGDEAYSVVVVLGHSAREAWETVLDPDHPPLFFVILRLTFLAFGASETTARLPSALASVCNLGLIFVLARRLGMTKRAGLSAVLLLALAPVDVWYAQEARMYALVTTTALLFAIGLAMESPAGAVLAGVALSAGLYTDFTMVPLSAALTAVWLVRWWHQGRPPWPLARVIVATSVAWWSYRPQWTHLWEILSRIDTVPLLVNLRESGIRLSPGRPASRRRHADGDRNVDRDGCDVERVGEPSRQNVVDVDCMGGLRGLHRGRDDPARLFGEAVHLHRLAVRHPRRRLVAHRRRP